MRSTQSLTRAWQVVFVRRHGRFTAFPGDIFVDGTDDSVNKRFIIVVCRPAGLSFPGPPGGTGFKRLPTIAATGTPVHSHD
ncbi:hypothetical protein DSCOOX_44250 [Desulfosarcina ovata subsp. ovata]|uniref:Uncharacterized protein n=1 Tax=Desulfosarcina ovata subsp. ovata TaxID=2752305 RepID=A0A5K8AF22_9BACT|nr:hypothetical protein DSCOOX_44250 [Desulfosarcina ovata subsp. ovata]